MKIPKTIGECADMLYKVRQERLALSKQVELLEADEKTLREHIITTLPKSAASGVAGKVALVTVVSKTVPQVEDWDALYKYVKKNNAFELLQRRVSDAAVKERWEGGKEVPGVVKFKATTVSINKV